MCYTIVFVCGHHVDHNGFLYLLRTLREVIEDTDSFHFTQITDKNQRLF